MTKGNCFDQNNVNPALCYKYYVFYLCTQIYFFIVVEVIK